MASPAHMQGTRATGGCRRGEMETPQNIIYNAWKDTPRPIIYETADAKGNPIIKEVGFAIPEENKSYDGSYIGSCNLCGKETYGGIPIKKMFS